MRIFGYELTRVPRGDFDPQKQLQQFETVLQRLVAMQEGTLGAVVTPHTCMQSPTVMAIITACTRRMAASALHVYQTGTSKGRETKEKLPSHPVARLLQAPNPWQTRNAYWLDAVSTLLRHGRYIAWKGRGSTGPIRRLVPLDPAAVQIEQLPSLDVVFRTTFSDGTQNEYDIAEMHHVRGPSRDFLTGDSAVKDVQLAIAMEILAERFGASFLQNGAMPYIFLHMLAGNKFKTKEEKDQFEQDFQNAFGGSRRFRVGVLPAGFDKPTSIPIENDKAQFLETRKYQRTVIAAAFGVPPHLVGDLERGTMNNVEQQSEDFKLNVVMPIAQQFEAAMERDLLTPADRASGVIIRFNLDSFLRASFKERQEGLRMQRDGGVLSPNEWREIEGRNPLSEDDGGEDYLRPANMLVAGEPLPEPNTPGGGGNNGTQPRRNGNGAQREEERT